MQKSDVDEAAGDAALAKAERRTGEGTADAKRDAQNAQIKAKKAREDTLRKLTCHAVSKLKALLSFGLRSQK